jgi:pimeloyl-ACP methyl ester carboxylesterase
MSPRSQRRRIAWDYKRACPYIMRLPATADRIIDRLRRIKAPTLITWGQKDRTLRPDSFAALAEYLPRPSCVPFENCGHQPHLGDPQAFQELLIPFLANPEAWLTIEARAPGKRQPER